MIYIENKKRKLEKLQEEYPGAIILDVTSQSQYESAKILSPFFPHGNIPIPFSNGKTALSVESIWQGLKVFESSDIDTTVFANSTMQGIKRSVRRYGKILGHRNLGDNSIMSYFDARLMIYLPSYKWILENVPQVIKSIQRIKEKSLTQDIVLLDYNTNTEFRDITKPLSHAGLIKLYIDGDYPAISDKIQPMTEEELREVNNAKKQQRKDRTKELKKQKTLF